MNCPYNVKVCTVCKRILIANSMNFPKDKKGKHGFSSRCSECNKEHKRKWYKNNKEYVREKNKEYYEENKEKISQTNAKYVEEHKEEIKKYKKDWYIKNKDKLSEENKKYREENPQVDFNNHAKRRFREENQGRGITKDQWYEMMCFFDWECAYSGIQLNKNNRSIDHIVCLDNNGEHEVWNCVPMYANYNYQKHTSDMKEWYIQQEFYLEERLIKIYAWCEYAFDKWKPRRKGNKKNQ